MEAEVLRGRIFPRRESTFRVKAPNRPELIVPYDDLRNALGSTPDDEQSFQECHRLSREMFERGRTADWVVFPSGEVV
jgi:hypothetical protein